MKKINVEIKGVTPLLINRFRDAQIEGKSKRKSGEQTEMQILDKLYLDENDKPYIPSVYIHRCLTDAGKRMQIRGKGKSTYSKLVGSTVDIWPEQIPLKEKWVGWRTSAVNPMTKGRMMVERPKFQEWSLKFQIWLNDDGISVSTMNEIVADAGKYTGIGDWRPEKKGAYGKFMLSKFEEVKE